MYNFAKSLLPASQEPSAPVRFLKITTVPASYLLCDNEKPVQVLLLATGHSM